MESSIKKSKSNSKLCREKSYSEDFYKGFVNILKNSKNDYEIWKLNKQDSIFEDYEFLRYTLQTSIDDKSTNKILTINDIYMRMYYHKIIEFMKQHSINGVPGVWFDLCRHSVGNVPAWLSINIFSFDPGGIDFIPDTLFTHEYILFVEKCSRELKGILVFKLVEDLNCMDNIYDEIQIKLLCTSIYTQGLGSRIIKSLKSFYNENTESNDKKVFARIIQPTKKATSFYEKMKFKKRSDGTMIKRIK
tara:strand:- start:801 stop:1541 length:741 start_codon:yes stop_codon:yes gene_type:complete